jgi:cobyrinic acid a,c-diamide synthase
MHDKPVGRGYVILEPDTGHPWRTADGAAAANPETGADALHAHEFHYSSLHDLPAGTRYAYTVRRGHGIDGRHDGILLHRLLASYTHLRATSRCDWPAKFVQHVRDCRDADNKETPPCSP